MPRAIDTPARSGEVICIDFIGPRPKSGGYDVVMVIVDKLTRFVVYVPLSTAATAQDVFGLLGARWMAYFGAPKAIISDRDARFTSKFWEHLWNGMRAELKRSTAFHPQTDGQTERANRTLIEGLKCFVNELRDDWAPMLPSMMRAANSSKCASTGYSPDMLLCGREARSALESDN